MQNLLSLLARQRGWNRVIRERLLGYILYAEHEWVEVLSGATATFCGAWLLYPGFDTFGSAKTFDFMSLVAPENTWGVCLTAYGLLQLAALILYDWSFRKTFIAFSGPLWGMFAGMFYVSNPAALGLPIFILYALFSVWAYWRMCNVECHR